MNPVDAPTVLPALPEILLVLGAMALLMVGAYRERSVQLVNACAFALLVLAALIVFALPSGKLVTFGGGFVVDSLLALWFFKRFGLSPPTVGAIFFAASFLAAVSQLGSSWLAQRIGLIRTMVFSTRRRTRTASTSGCWVSTAAAMRSATVSVRETGSPSTMVRAWR